MSEVTQQGILSRKTAELVFAGFLLAFGAAIIVGAREMETGWDNSGPEAGYFPLRIGLLIVASASYLLVREALRTNGGVVFLSKSATKNIALFALPLVLLMVLIPWIGLYLAAAAYLALAVGLIGRVPWLKALMIALLTPTAMLLLFEFAFKTPLPKGPLGPLFGML